MITGVEKHMSRGSTTSTAKRAGPQRLPNVLGPPTYAETAWPTATKFWYSNTYRGVSCFKGQPRPRPKGAGLQGSQKLLGLPIRTPKQFDLEQRNLVWYHTLGSSVFPRLHLKGGPGVPQILGLPTCAHTVWETAAKFCIMIKLCEAYFTRSTTNADARSVCGS